MFELTGHILKSMAPLEKVEISIGKRSVYKKSVNNFIYLIIYLTDEGISSSK